MIGGISRRWWPLARESPGLGEAGDWVILEERREGGFEN